MKVEWEAKDIRPGRRYRKEGCGEVWLIGYLAADDTQGRYVSISECDGMVTSGSTKDGLAAMLTAGRYLPVEICNTDPKVET